MADDPDLALSGEAVGIRSGAYGVDDFIAWLGVEAEFTFAPRNYLTSNSIVSIRRRRRAPMSSSSWDYVGTARGRVGYAAGHWLCLRHRRALPMPASASLNAPARRRRSEGTESRRLGWAAGGGVEYAFAPHWSVRLGISLQPVRVVPTSASRRRAVHTRRSISSQLRIGLNRKIDWPGSNELDAEDRSDRPRIRSLGNPRPNHLSAAGLSRIPRALHRHQQPDAGARRHRRPGATASYLNAAALGRRRGLLQSRTAAGVWPETTPSVPRGFSSGEAQKSNFPYPHYNTSRLFVRQTFGFGGEQEELASGPTAARRQGRRLPADAAGRQVRGARCFRRQRLRQGHPQGLHELVDLGAGRIRLFRRQGRPDLRRAPPSSTRSNGRCAAAIS